MSTDTISLADTVTRENGHLFAIDTAEGTCLAVRLSALDALADFPEATEEDPTPCLDINAVISASSAEPTLVEFSVFRGYYNGTPVYAFVGDADIFFLPIDLI